MRYAPVSNVCSDTHEHDLHDLRVDGPAARGKLATMTTDDIVGDLKRISDEIRVRIHLASMDAKDAWANLEPRVREFEAKIERASERAAAEVDKLAGGLRDELTRLRKRVFED